MFILEVKSRGHCYHVDVSNMMRGFSEVVARHFLFTPTEIVMFLDYDYLNGFQMSIKHPTSGGQTHDQEAAV